MSVSYRAAMKTSHCECSREWRNGTKVFESTATWRRKWWPNKM